METTREFGSVVVELGFATADEVRDAIREQRRIQRSERRKVFLAEILAARGALGPARLARALDAARGYREASDPEGVRLGEVAIAKAYASPAQVYESLVEQRDEVLRGSPRRLLGEIMLERCRLTPWELEDVLVTAAELAAGSLRSGATPSDAIPVGPNLYGGGEVYARRYRREAVRTETGAPPSQKLVRDALARAVRTTPDTRVGVALDLAIEADAEAILVFHHEELVGTLCVFEAGAVDPGVGVARMMRPAGPSIDALSPLDEAAALLHAHDRIFLPVTSGGDVLGVVTCSALRRAGLKIERAHHDLGGSD